MTDDARLLIVSPAELAGGFRLAGVDVATAETPDGADRVIRELLADGERGVIGVYAPLFDGLEEGFQRRLSASVSPVVVAIPTGIGTEPEVTRRDRLARRLQRAIGFHITFSEEGQ